MKKNSFKILALTLMLASAPVIPQSKASAEVLKTTVSVPVEREEDKGIKKEDYYDKMREVMPEGSYGSNGYSADDYWSCAGWAAHVIYEAGKNGAFGGYVPDYGNTATACAGDLEVFMQNDSHFELVSYFNENSGSAAREEMNKKVKDGTIKAGDIIIYHEYGSSYSSSYGKAHAAIIIEETFDGTTDTYTGYGEDRWPDSLIGEATVANSLNYSYGTEFYTPVNSFFEIGQASGYAVYRVKYEKPKKTAVKQTVKKAEKVDKNETSTVEGTVIPLPVNETGKLDKIVSELEKANEKKTDDKEFMLIK
ncbi:hypothetical protein SAMN04487934_101562 [Eubacterium ruminantium]|nr:hypothetical protein SAMN04487934_101562 [Eubacterium ruminantium]